MNKFTVSYDQYKESFQIHYIPRLFKSFSIATLVVVAFIASLCHSDLSVLMGMSIFGLTWMIFIGLIVYFVNKFKFNKTFHENEEIRNEMAAWIEDGELKIKTDKSITSIPRNRVCRVQRGKNITLLYRTQMLFHIIPNILIDDDVELSKWLTNR